jgi:hypothetical protein
MLDVANTSAPTQFFLHPEDNAPFIPGQPDSTPVSLHVNINNTETGIPEDYCADFESGIAASQSPIRVKPCSPHWDISSNSSQLFLYDTVTSTLSPFWPSFLQNLTSSGSGPGNSSAAKELASTPLQAPPTTADETLNEDVPSAEGSWEASNNMHMHEDRSAEDTETAPPHEMTPAFLVFHPAADATSLFNSINLAANDDADPADPSDSSDGSSPDGSGDADASPTATPDDSGAASFYAANGQAAAALATQFANLTPDSRTLVSLLFV